MGRAGRIIIDPRLGAFCRITLESGDELIVAHDTSGFRGGTLTIDRADGPAAGARIHAWDLGRTEGRTALADLVRQVNLGVAGATPLRLLIAWVRSCPSLDELKRRCHRADASPDPAV